MTDDEDDDSRQTKKQKILMITLPRIEAQPSPAPAAVEPLPSIDPNKC